MKTWILIRLVKVYDDNQKHDYYNKASFKLTLQFLLQFIERKLIHKKLKYKTTQGLTNNFQC
jgi:hypothetical protein